MVFSVRKGKPSKPGKIDKVVMEQMYRSGKGHAEIAAHFGCSRQAVQIAHNALVARMEMVPELVAQSELSKDNLDTISQLGKINKTIMEELDRARRLVIREDEKVKEVEKLEEQVKRDPNNTMLVAALKDKAGINFANILKIQASVIDISAEVRKQLELQLKIAETLYSATMIAQFQEEVLAAIGRIDPATRMAIIIELKQLRTIRGLMHVKKG